MRRLLIRPGAIGDCIVSLPALECLCDGYTEVWVAAQNVPLIRFADRVRAISATGLDLLEIHGPEVLPALLSALRGFDSIISWYGANRAEFRETVAGLGLPFTFLPALPDGQSVHAADFYLQQARVLRQCPGDGIPRIRCDGVVQGNYAVIHPFSGSGKKNWPLDSFREVAEALGEDVPVEWCSGPEESLNDARRIDDLYELAVWLAGARLYIGNDSGITHLAAAVGTPVVALFGPTNPAVWAPRGRSVRVMETAKAGEPVASISVTQVIEAARDLLLERSAASPEKV